MSQKYYAVKIGRCPGIYLSWDNCRLQVEGFPGAQYRSFSRLDDAGAYLTQTEADAPAAGDSSLMEAWVDGSFDAGTGVYSYAVVIWCDGKETLLAKRIENAEMAAMRNVAGEITGAVRAMKVALAAGVEELVIYHDYEGIEKWCTGAWRTNREGTRAYKAFYDRICDRLKIRFVKIKSHTGDPNNERADRLAKGVLGLPG